ncbi:MAG: zinc-dependent metalloprotease [Chitinophagales bacterium]|jgi:hypothetical protein|nr:zinc-dependent metalloprotease [Chitinophagales bacterium]
MKHLFLILILNSFLSLSAQQAKPNFCGTKDTDIDIWLAKLDMIGGRAYLDPNRIKQREDNFFWVPIHYHVLRKSDGSGQYYQEWLLLMNQELNDAYSFTNVRFFIDKVSYHNTDTYYNITNSTDDAVNKLFGSTTACNVFLTNDPAGNCGYTRRPTVTGKPEDRFPIFVAASATNTNCALPKGKTLIHEMGHWLDLAHTFYEWEGKAFPTNPADTIVSRLRENVTRNPDDPCFNCYTTADGFCDTEADYTSGRYNCPSGRIITDPCGRTFRQDATGWNTMSYADDACIGAGVKRDSSFSLEQARHMDLVRKFPDRRDLDLLPDPKNVAAGSVQNFIPKKGDILPRSKVLLTFDSAEDAEMYLISVISGTTSLNINYKFPSASGQQTLWRNLIVDTIVTSNSIEIDARRFPNSDVFYYWRVIPVTKAKQVKLDEYETNYFKLANFSFGLEKNNETCTEKNDGKINFLNTSTFKFFLDGSEVTDGLEGLAPNIYEIEVRDANNQKVATQYVRINAAEAPKVALRVENGFAYLDIQGGAQPYSIKWNTGASAPTVKLTSSLNSVTVTDANECFKKVLTLNTGGIDANIKDLPFITFKNPAPIKENLTLEFESLLLGKQSHVQVQDLQGRILATQDISINSVRQQLDWKIQSAGIYFLVVQVEDSIKSYKLIVQE